MDNATLTKEQLYQVIAYVERRGFHTRLVVLEILDHFACKVEEKMKSNPSISLDEAMERAHDDFGVLGFSPIVKAYNAGLNKKYKNVYRTELKKAFSNPLYVIGAIVASCLFYKGYAWADVNHYNHIIDFNDVSILFYGMGASVYITYSLKFQRTAKENPIYNAIFRRDKWLFISLGVLCGLASTIVQFVGTALVFYSIIYLTAMYKTLKKGAEEISIYNGYLNSLAS